MSAPTEATGRRLDPRIIAAIRKSVADETRRQIVAAFRSALSSLGPLPISDGERAIAELTGRTPAERRAIEAAFLREMYEANREMHEAQRRYRRRLAGELPVPMPTREDLEFLARTRAHIATTAG